MWSSVRAQLSPYTLHGRACCAQVKGSLAQRLALLGAMGGTQGLVGWWMVRSGLQVCPPQAPAVLRRIILCFPQRPGIWLKVVLGFRLGAAAVSQAEICATHGRRSRSMHMPATCMLHIRGPCTWARIDLPPSETLCL